MTIWLIPHVNRPVGMIGATLRRLRVAWRGRGVHVRIMGALAAVGNRGAVTGNGHGTDLITGREHGESDRQSNCQGGRYSVRRCSHTPLTNGSGRWCQILLRSSRPSQRRLYRSLRLPPPAGRARRSPSVKMSAPRLRRHADERLPPLDGSRCWARTANADRRPRAPRSDRMTSEQHRRTRFPAQPA